MTRDPAKTEAVAAILARFDHVIESSKAGIRKPDPRIYALALTRCRLDPARTVFVDDLVINVEAARASGLRALHFTGPEKLRAELAALRLI